jgi:hypothetical protein
MERALMKLHRHVLHQYEWHRMWSQAAIMRTGGLAAPEANETTNSPSYVEAAPE